MKWASFAVGAVLVAAVFVFFPAPPPAVGIGMMSLGSMLLLDWSLDNCIGFASWGGLELRSDEIEADFYSLKRARWRYLLAIAASLAMAAVFALSDSEVSKAIALVGGFAVYGLFALFSVLRSRQRVAKTDATP